MGLRHLGVRIKLGWEMKVYRGQLIPFTEASTHKEQQSFGSRRDNRSNLPGLQRNS